MKPLPRKSSRSISSAHSQFDRDLLVAQAAHQKGELDGALAQYQALLSLDPHHPKLLNNLGILWSQKDEHERAKTCLLTAIEHHPRDLDAHLNLGVIQERFNELDAALASYAQAVALSPEHALAQFNLGNLLMKMSRFSEALTCLDQALQIKPGRAAFLLKRGLILLEMKRSRQALKDLAQTIKKEPSWFQVNFYLGQAHSDLNEHDLALKHYDAFLDKNPQSFEAYTNRGHVLQQLGRPDLAQTSYQQALEINPDFYMTHLNLGVLYQEMNHVDLAVQSYARSLELNPRVAQTHANLGSALKAQGLYQNAKVSFDHAVALDAGYAPAYFNLGLMYFELQQFEGTVKNFTKAIELHPGFAEAYFHRANIHFQQQKFSSAKADIERSIEAGFKRRLEAEYILHALESQVKSSAFKDAPPPEFVSNLFNQYAPYFERQLVQELAYQSPNFMLGLMQPFLAPGPHAFLDLGCGTGLSGAVMAPLAKSLVGVDLSFRMLDVAREKNIYSELIECDIVEFLTLTKLSFDVVLSLDVFIYVGDLSKVFAGIHRVLNPRGCFAFTVEEEKEKKEEKEGISFSIHASTMRFKHTKSYCDALASVHGFVIQTTTPALIRKNQGEDVMGLYYVLRKIDPS